MDNEHILPAAPLRGIVFFPGSSVSFDVVRKETMRAIDEAINGDNDIFLVTQKDITIEKPGFLDLYKIGCIASVKQFIRLPNGIGRVMVEIKKRARLVELIENKGFKSAKTAEVEEIPSERDVALNQAFIRSAKEAFEEYINVLKKVFHEKVSFSIPADNMGVFADGVASNIQCEYEIKQELLETLDPYERIEKVLVVLKKETEIAETKQHIDNEVKKRMDEHQREYYLREEMKVIEQELGDKDGYSEEISEYRRKIKELCLDEENEEKLLKQTERLSKMPSGSPDVTVIKNYLDIVLELPWNKMSEDEADINNAAELLDSEHYGMEKVKERVLEYLAVHKLTDGRDGTVLCLSGSPGTGKTSVAASVARALGRKFVRISLGGVHDEAEIRGHRKTYIGSMPGRIISAIKQAGTNNPVILLDEIDKMGADLKGDPSAALLEVLDFEQNSSFRDNFIELPFDLSQVIFIATANDVSNIPKPLYDRVEMIEVPGYTNIAKLEIAKGYLIPKQLEKNGLKGKRVTVTDDAVMDIINYYTREAGVRGLERKIAELMRKVARMILSEERKSAKITSKNLTNYLGRHKFSFDMKNETDEVGVVRGLAWTSVGGDTLSVEVNVMPGTGKIELTGNLGDVMRESAMTAVSYVRSQSESLKIDKDFYKNKDIHIHVPEGAVPKDGPSAGITIATAVASALTDIPVKCDVAMTGEITLRGNVLPIGGLREKSLAAYRAGIKTIIIPKENYNDIEDIPESVRKEINFVTARKMDTVLENAFGSI